MEAYVEYGVDSPSQFTSTVIALADQDDLVLHVGAVARRSTGGAGDLPDRRSVRELLGLRWEAAKRYGFVDGSRWKELVMRGLSTIVPAVGAYLDHLPQPYVDGGYYTKTQENRPLVGPMPVEGAYVIGALSGFGLTASPASGVLAETTSGWNCFMSPASRFLQALEVLERLEASAALVRCLARGRAELPGRHDDQPSDGHSECHR